MQFGAQIGIVGQRAVGDQVDVGVLRVRQQHGELGHREAGARRLPLGDLLVGGQELERPVDPSVGLESVQVAGVHVHHREGLPAGDGERERLRDVVGQHLLAHLVGHRREQLVAFVDRHPRRRHDVVEEDLDVHLVVAAVDTGRVVDGVGVHQATRECIFDAAALGEAEVAALAHHAAAQVGAVHTQAVVGPVAHIGVRFGRGLHIGADTAVPEQVDRGTQDGRDELDRREGAALDTEHPLHLGRQLDALGGARVHAAAGRDERGVVVGPTAARQGEQPDPFGERLGGIGRRVAEDVPVVEGRHQAQVR